MDPSLWLQRLSPEGVRLGKWILFQVEALVMGNWQKLRVLEMMGEADLGRQPPGKTHSMTCGLSLDLPLPRWLNQFCSRHKRQVKALTQECHKLASAPGFIVRVTCKGSVPLKISSDVPPSELTAARSDFSYGHRSMNRS